MIGERVNNYQIVSLLGEGGMGAVYLAEHPFMGRKAAIKVLRREFAEDRGLVERFMNEARAANAIRHANIIDIIDVGQLPSGIPYLMMEFLDGESLAARVARLGKLEVGEAVDIVEQTATALGAAHAKGIVHRDLKPDNLFLLPDDTRASGLRVKVLDFGIAKLRGELTGSGAKTQSGSLMGTPPYMSPEQCRGLSDEIDERTDIYALGIILYELLCGAPPFVSAGWGDIVLMHITQPPVSPRSRNPGIPAAVEAVILKALAKERADRFASMKDLQLALRAAMAGVPARASGDDRVSAAATAPTVSVTPAPRTAGTPSSHPATTTFRTGTGELVSYAGRTSVEPAESARSAAAGPSRRRPLAITAAALGAVALSVLVMVLVKTRGPDGVPPPGAAPPETGALAGVVPTASGKSSTPAKKSDLHVGAVTRHSVRLASEPAGARVVDTKSGAVIGSTPLDRAADDGDDARVLRLSKEGFEDATVSVPPRQEFERTVVLERTRPSPGEQNHGLEQRPSKNGRGRRGLTATVAKMDGHQPVPGAATMVRAAPPIATPSAVNGSTTSGSVPTGATTKPKAAAEKW